jgi:NTP pyrophosphatase (non-canonical NTP hydrolase)
MKQRDVLDLIIEERERQDEKWGKDNPHSDFVWLAILVEEIGEVSNEMLSPVELMHSNGLKKELTQVAAVVVAWLEDMK